MPSAIMKSLAEAGSRSVTVETAARDNGETAIRVGNTGLAQSLAKLAAACIR
jgi:hypothetical protein